MKFKDRFPRAEIERLANRAASLEQQLGGRWELCLARVQHCIHFTFGWDGVPEADFMTHYLHANYDCAPGGIPALVKCESVEEADYFLDLVEEWTENNPGTYPDYAKIAKAEQAVHWDALAGVACNYSDEHDPDSLPCEAEGRPCWIDLPGFDEAELVTTADWSTAYGSHCDIPVPEEPALLVKVIGDDIGGEAETELEQAMDLMGIRKGLEEFLFLQLLCHYDGQWAYFRYDIICGTWLAAVPENEDLFELAVEQEDFLDYYDDYARPGEESDRQRAVREWQEQVAKEKEEW